MPIMFLQGFLYLLFWGWLLQEDEMPIIKESELTALAVAASDGNSGFSDEKLEAIVERNNPILHSEFEYVLLVTREW